MGGPVPLNACAYLRGEWKQHHQGLVASSTTKRRLPLFDAQVFEEEGVNVNVLLNSGFE